MKLNPLRFALVLVTAPLVSTLYAAITLNVDCSKEFRDVTHSAIGSLYGVVEDIPADLTALVKPLNPNMFTNPARAGSGYQQPKGAAIPVAERLANAGISSASVTIRLADLCPGWPYRFPGWDKWKSQVEAVIADKQKSNGKYYGYEIWNEWQGTWQGPDNSMNVNDVSWQNRSTSFYKLWSDTYKLIREKDPTAKIIGPSDAWYAPDRIRHFLTYCVQNNCVPDIISWHELGGTAGITNSVNTYRSLEKELGISPARPISINEYGESQSDGNYEGCPGRSAAIIAKIERLNIETASISWWHTQYPGRLGSLLGSNTGKGAGWYFYNWYGEMTGKMITVTPPNTNTKGVDGFANIDSNKKFISLLFGGENDASGSVDIKFSNLPSWIGSSAKIKIEAIDWTSLTTVSSGPRTISEKEYAVTNNAVSVSVANCNNTSGYRVYITPANANVTNATCNVNNLESSYDKGSSVPRPNIICENGATAGTASFSINGTLIDGWNSAGGTHALYNTGTRAVVLNSAECGNATVTLNPPASCGSFEIVDPEPSPILNSQFSILNSQITYYSIKGEPLGSAKPQKSGVYIVKQGHSVKKIVVR